MRPNLTKRQAAERIIDRLKKAGHAALLAGGSVRDLLLQREPKDYDVVTDAVPDQIIRLFRRTDKVGQQFGVVLVRQGSYAIEVATFRTDDHYSDGRRPDSVRFSDPRHDAERRDFTINGMFLDTETGQVIDFVGGRRDIEGCVIRAIGEPDLRFVEDHLRLLRAVRFATRFDFTIEPATLAAMQRHADRLPRISTERIRGELVLILSDPNRVTGWQWLRTAGLLPWLIRGLDWDDEQFQHVEAILRELPHACSEGLLLAALLEKFTGAAAAAYCRALTCSNRVVEEVRWLLDAVPVLRRVRELEMADFKLLMACTDFPDLQRLLAARTNAGLEEAECLQAWNTAVERIAPDEVAPPRLVTGEDLIQLGLPPGPKFGRILEQLYRRQLNGHLRDRDAALNAARELIKSKGIVQDEQER